LVSELFFFNFDEIRTCFINACISLLPLTFLLESIEILPSDIQEEMGAVGKLDVLVQKYLKRTRRF
jgi:hypothetical protein